MYLLDTNVLSELRRPSGNRKVKEWVAGQRATDLAISVVTVLEIEIGILKVARKDRARAAVLTDWFEGHVLTGFAERILPLDLAAVRRVAPLHVPNRAPERDALIAGTALAHGLTVATRNVADFQPTGVPMLNPWKTD